jgi:hypothetical protein
MLAPVSLALALCGVSGGVFEGGTEQVAAQRRSSSSAMRAGHRSSNMSSRMRSARGSSSRGRRARRGRRPPPRVTPAYRRQVVRWHRRPAPDAVASWEQQAPPPLVFRPVRYPGEYALVPDASGAFSEYQLRAARKAFTYRDALTHDVHPALMERAYRIVREFRVPYLWLISGYRDTRSTSRHSQGRAMDVVAPGVSNAQLARFARGFGFTGVGEYPQSGFVHIDVRARSYFWVDRSAPGARSRERQVRRSEAARADRSARQGGDAPVDDAAEQADSEADDQAEATSETPDAAVPAAP